MKKSLYSLALERRPQFEKGIRELEQSLVPVRDVIRKYEHQSARMAAWNMDPDLVKAYKEALRKSEKIERSIAIKRDIVHNLDEIIQLAPLACEIWRQRLAGLKKNDPRRADLIRSLELLGGPEVYNAGEPQQVALPGVAKIAGSVDWNYPKRKQ